MKIDIQARDFDLTDDLREHVMRRLGFALSQFQDPIRRVVVCLSDINGPRGGVDKPCYLGVRLNGLSEILVEETEVNFHIAVNRAAEEALRERDERLRLAAETALIGTWEFDLREGSGKWDDRALRLTGLSPSDGGFDPQSWLRIVDPLDRERVARAFQNSLAVEALPYDVEFRCAVCAPDGGPRWLSSHGAVIRDPNDSSPIKAIGILQDVTARRRSDRRLAESDARFRASQELALDGFTILRAVRNEENQVVDFHCEYANKSAHRLLKVKSLEGKSLLTHLPGHFTHPHLFPRYVATLVHGEPSQLDLNYDADGVNGWFRNAVTRLDSERIGIWFQDITERKKAEEERKFLVQELSHRVKNTLSLVQAIVRQTVPQTDARDTLEQRLMSLSRAHEMLVQSDWSSAELRAILEGTMLVVQNRRIVMDGPPVRLLPRAAVHMAIAFHELATNALKYGALSNDTGIVYVDWTAHNGQLKINWVEQGGPEVHAPRERGFGTAVLQRVLPAELSGHVETVYHPDGLRCSIRAPLQNIVAGHIETSPLSRAS